MAYALKKKVGVRVSRFLDQLIELRKHCEGDGDASGLEQSITAARGLCRQIEDVFFVDATPAPARAKAKKDDDVTIIYPCNLPPATMAPGAVEAKPKPYTHPVRALIEDDDEGRGVAANITDDEWVDAAIAGKVGGVSIGEAAKQLSADAATWAMLDTSERIKAINALADKIEAEYNNAEDRGIF